MSLLPSGAIESAGYDINNSLRFRSSASAYLNRTPASAGNRQIWTWSGWVKRGTITSSGDLTLFSAGTTSPSYDSFRFTNDALQFFQGAGATSSVQTTQLFRDPSAWYHIVLAVDTTQATASNRIKIYVNGNQVTALSSASYPSQNTSASINNTLVHAVGALWITSAQQYFDGYMSEVNFIDGQALTPSSFGETDAVTGVWKAKKYTGTYGTNGFYLPFILNNTSNHAGLFNGSRSLSVASNAVFGYGTSDFTIEGWFYFNNLNTQSVVSNLTNGSSTAPHIYYDSSSGLSYYTVSAIRINGGALQANNWYHIALCRSGSSTRMFVNGIQVGSTYSDSNNYGTSNPFVIGDYGSPLSGSAQFNGNISNVRVVKGTALYTSNFVPSSLALTAISGTSILTLQNSTIVDNSGNSLSITNTGTVTTATATPFVANIFGDNSGNNNNWVGNNINYSILGTTYDAMTDSPTNTSATVANYCVLSPLAGDVAPTNGNLSVSGVDKSTLGTVGVSSGKWYFEMTCVSNVATTNLDGVGIGNCAVNNSAPDKAFYIYRSNGNKLQNGGSNTAYGASFTTGDVIGVAYDADAGSLVFYKNNTSQGTAFTGITGTMLPIVYARGITSTPTLALNFGQRPFSYTPPTGFVALNTFNLPAPTILQGNKYMDAKLYTGTNANQSINSYGFSPDLIWIKNRDNVEQHHLVDSVRGNNKFLLSNSTAAERTGSLNNGYNQVNLASTGFDIVSNGLNDELNLTGRTYVAWGWDANGAGSSNTSGSITSTVSANTTAGFSVVTWTGNGTVGATVGHSLGVAPKMVIMKRRNGATNWQVWITGFNATTFLFLQSTNAVSTAENYFNSTLPSSTLLTLSANSEVNASGGTYVAYCWAEIAGFSKFGSYTGNGSTDGPFVYLGFRPKYLMIKQSNSASEWGLHDTTRDTYNTVNKVLFAHGVDAEIGSVDFFDFTANGFKIRSSNANRNTSGGTYIYMAFAENPFKNSLAR